MYDKVGGIFAKQRSRIFCVLDAPQLSQIGTHFLPPALFSFCRSKTFLNHSGLISESVKPDLENT